MGCDYYILKILYIYFDKDDYLFIEIDRQQCYYYCDFDEDEEGYKEKYEKYKEDMLTPQTKPILIYENHKFNQLSSETKYKNMIENKITNYGNGKKWENITKIIKVEERYERE